MIMPRRPAPLSFLTVALALALGAAHAAAVPARPSGPPAGQDERLARTLEKAKAYCQRLERAALDFICTERIEEVAYRLPEFRMDETGRKIGFVEVELAPRRANTNTYVYDYQYVRKGNVKKEQRILIEENGRKVKEDDADLMTRTVRVENALFGPIGLLGVEWQPLHDYKVAGEETLEGKAVLVVQALPKQGLGDRERPHAYGRVWIREEDGAVVKIDWDQSSIGNFAQIRQEARRLEAEPQLVSLTEYGVAKGGLRFPSRDATEEAYLARDGKRIVKSSTTIAYTDYKFFTVETEVGF